MQVGVDDLPEKVRSAMLRAIDLVKHPTWGNRSSAVRAAEAPLEPEVSAYIGQIEVARESEKATNGLIRFELRTAIVCREELKDRGTKGNRRD